MTAATSLQRVLERAVVERWCTDATLARCTPGQFIAELHTLKCRFGKAYIDEILQTEPSTWYDLPDWVGALRITLGELNGEETDKLLRSWLPRLLGHVRIIDAIIFYAIRRSEVSESVRQEWFDTGAELAIALGDPSLMETLLYSIGEQMRGHPRLIAAAMRLGGAHPGLRRAVKEVLGPL